MRQFALVLICVPVACAGALYARFCRKRARTLSSFASFFGCLAISAAAFGGEIPVLLSRCVNASDKSFSFPATLLTLYAQTGDLCAAWEAALQTCGIPDLLQRTQCELLQDCGGMFALESMAAFESTCKGYEAQFTALYKDAAEKLKREERLYVTLSSLLAALLFLILI